MTKLTEEEKVKGRSEFQERYDSWIADAMRAGFTKEQAEWLLAELNQFLPLP